MDHYRSANAEVGCAYMLLIAAIVIGFVAGFVTKTALG